MCLLPTPQQQPSPAAVRSTTSAGIVNTVSFRPAAAPRSLKLTQQTVLAGKTTSPYFADTADIHTPHENNYTFTQTDTVSTRSTHTFRITQHDITGPAHHLLFQLLTPHSQHQPHHRHRHRLRHTPLLILLTLLLLPPLKMIFRISPWTLIFLLLSTFRTTLMILLLLLTSL